jgi:aldose 1-epimerase
MHDPSERITLVRGDVELVLVPRRGGGIAAFRWRGVDVFRPETSGDQPQDLACFPLVPFSNRIALGRFVAGADTIRLVPNLPGVSQPHAIHGIGWQCPWTVTAFGADHALLTHCHHGQAWPWPYRADQHFELDETGFSCRLTLRNDGPSAMPAGLGLHPYFPRAGAVLDVRVTGQWDTDGTGLPTGWRALPAPPNWFGGPPIDHVFTGRTTPITIDWPGRRLTITPAEDLGFTVVYVPPGEDYFCVEPVSHMTDAVNRNEPEDISGLRWLAPGELWHSMVHFAVGPAA